MGIKQKLYEFDSANEFFSKQKDNLHFLQYLKSISNCQLFWSKFKVAWNIEKLFLQTQLCYFFKCDQIIDKVFKLGKKHHIVLGIRSVFVLLSAL